jgi:hypothetical protein
MRKRDSIFIYLGNPPRSMVMSRDFDRKRRSHSAIRNETPRFGFEYLRVKDWLGDISKYRAGSGPHAKKRFSKLPIPHSLSLSIWPCYRLYNFFFKVALKIPSDTGITHKTAVCVKEINKILSSRGGAGWATPSLIVRHNYFWRKLNRFHKASIYFTHSRPHLSY